MIVINSGIALVALSLLGLGGWLQLRSQLAVGADTALLAIGGGLLSASIFGLVGSLKCTSRPQRAACVLRVYTSAMCLVLVGMACLVGFVAASGEDGIVSDSALRLAAQLYRLDEASFETLLAQQYYVLLIAGTIITFLLLLVIVAACLLQHILRKLGDSSTASERAGLLADTD